MTAHGAFHWNELRTWDADKAKKFYAASLGWTFEAMDGAGGNYWIAMSGGAPVGGIFQMSKGQGMDDAPEGWSVFIAVDDLDKRLKALKNAGGTVMVEPWDVPGVGRIALVMDPGGAAQGWMVPAEQTG
jgi:predicted enzyme related to lactoylglutathione lyase